MARYRIFYLRDSLVAAFRDSVPKQPYRLKPSQYEEGGEIESAGPYAAWQLLQGEEAERRGVRGLAVGDVIEEDPSTIYLCNFWGFDAAEWILPDAGPHQKDGLREAAFGGRPPDETSVVPREAAAC